MKSLTQLKFPDVSLVLQILYAEKCAELDLTNYFIFKYSCV